ncbi:Endonuclease/exonuclease/phosphatase [Chaetomium tenue]|uniref:Endonuclease/exonuclease/phosphatase n=1 Tax=Chaetomium tenue TaxID=1854479 RepID=A0ACB7P5D8_9PEZI|nr:Endonuclease/exonuclease/phosphatase [Chaetomium globosum]
MEHQDRKTRAPPSAIQQREALPQRCLPHVYRQESSRWVLAKFADGGQTLRHETILKVVCWNLDAFSPDPRARGSAAMSYLGRMFGDVPGCLVLMLQEVCPESLQAILEHPWVQRNFIVSNTEPPESVIRHLPGESFVLVDTVWKCARYFTLLLVPRSLTISDCFRVPFVTTMGRDALVVDLVFDDSRSRPRTQGLRLCTTHLESLWEGKAYRLGQLALVSSLLKGERGAATEIVGGIVGGDMNAIDRSEHEFHRVPEVALKDVWEDEPAPPLPVLKPFQKDITYGRARGNTWGYQSAKARERKRMDKFLYTGSLETVPVTEAQDLTGRMARLGIGLKTEMLDSWVSDHFGIAVGIRPM